MQNGLSAIKKNLLEKLLHGQFSKERIKKLNRNIAPLSCAQRRVWLLEQLFPNTAMYNMYYAVRFEGAVDKNLLQEAINIIFNRHEILKTQIFIENESPVQKIQEISYVTIEVIAKNKITAKVKQPFDLKKDLLLRVYYIEEQDGNSILLIITHHLISDGWSMEIFFSELGEIYESLMNRRKPNLLPLPFQYFDYIYGQKDFLQSKDILKQIDYWKNQLGIDDNYMLKLPIDHPRPLVPSYKGKRIKITISKNLTGQIKSICRKRDATPFMFFLAVFDILLYRYTSETGITIGIPIANRRIQEIEKLIGFFANTMIIRANLSDDIVFTELLEKIKKVTTEAYSNQDVPFEKVVEIIQPKRIASGSPLFNVAFVLQKPQDRHKLKIMQNLTAEPIFIHNETCKFDLLLTLSEYDGEIRGAFEYSADLFEDVTIRQLCKHYLRLIGRIIQEPYEKVGIIDFLLPKELKKNSVNAMRYSAKKNICHLFEEQVKKTPNNR